MSCSSCVGDTSNEIDYEQENRTLTRRFVFCLVFTVPLMLHMAFPYPVLHDPWFQLVMAVPVVAIGLYTFLPSALRSLRGFYPNMNVLISIGFLSAFIYSCLGIWLHRAEEFMFFETAASIVCYVLLGNLIEHRAERKTESAVAELVKISPKHAKKISGEGASKAFSDIDVKDITAGDRIFVGTGDTIPTDGTTSLGGALVNEALVTGEALPQEKNSGDFVVSGSVVENGTLEYTATVDSAHSLLAEIIRTVKLATTSKPSIQRIGDTVSAIFVPTVLLFAIATFVYAYLLSAHSFTESMLRSIAVLVVACPCAMGLATPMAVMVAIGRAARSGILIKGGDVLERIHTLKTFVFDKTGTLTTGEFQIADLKVAASTSSDTVKSYIYSLESHSNHPIAKSLTRLCKDSVPIALTDVTEHKGLKIEGMLPDGRKISIGSKNILKDGSLSSADVGEGDLYLTENDSVIATLTIKDTIRSSAHATIQALHRSGYRTALLSGDRAEKCAGIARELGIETVFSQKTPNEKLAELRALQASVPVAYIGDGINDTPSLTAAQVGISFGDASGAAIASASAVVLSSDLYKIPELIALSHATIRVIKQNLFWAFFYNILMIPLASFGFLSPSVAALAMAFSDVFVIGNSFRLRSVKL